MLCWSTITETPGLGRTSIAFTEGVTFTVNAPASKVFDIITDFQNYGSWNTWSPSFEFQGQHEICVGSQGILTAKALKRDYKLPVEIIKLGKFSDSHVLAFRGLLLPSWFAVVERVHTVVSSTEGQSCEVISWESMGGWGAFILKYALSAPLQVQDANVKFAHDLALYAEEQK